MIELRDYQQEAIEALREGIRSGHKRQILCAPTGSGKTEMAMSVIEEALKKNTRTAFITDRLSILYQTEARFDTHGLDFGVMQSGHYRFKPWEPLQLCSSQTLARRGIDTSFKLAVVDECHVTYASTTNFLLAHPEIITLGLSASPFTKGLGEIYSNVVNCTTTNKLIEQGWLSAIRVFAAKAIDVKGVKVASTGEWDAEELTGKGREIVGDIVQCWIDKTQELFGGPVKTIVFTPTVAYGAELCAKWQEAGYNFVQISYKDGNDNTRRDILDDFRSPDTNITGLISCTALAKGFDVVDIRCGVDAHPYRKSLSSVIQQIGRVMRPHSSKEYALWIDHANNFTRFYDDITTFFEEGLKGLGSDRLDSSPRKEPTEKTRSEILCAKCRCVLPPGSEVCPNCGHPRPKRKSGIEELPGELQEIVLGRNGKPLEPWLQDKESVAKQIWHYSLSKKGGNIQAARRFALAQYRNIYLEWPKGKIEDYDPEEPHPRLISRIKANLIRWHHSKQMRAT